MLTTHDPKLATPVRMRNAQMPTRAAYTVATSRAACSMKNSQATSAGNSAMMANQRFMGGPARRARCSRSSEHLRGDEHEQADHDPAIDGQQQVEHLARLGVRGFLHVRSQIRYGRLDARQGDIELSVCDILGMHRKQPFWCHGPGHCHVARGPL